MRLYLAIILTQHSTANLLQFDWSKTYRERRLHFDRIPEPETTWTIFCAAASKILDIVVVVVLLFYVHGKHLRSSRGGPLTYPHSFWASLDLLSG